MKKTIKSVIFLAIALITIISCQKDEVDPENVPSQRVLFNSSDAFNNQVRVFGTVSLSDFSSGVVSRAWSFPSAATIDESAESIVTTFFSQPGEQRVTLNQTFKEDAFVNGTLRGRELDTTIVITVLDSIRLKLSANILNSDGSVGAALNMADNAKNEVFAGSGVRFTLETTGQPDVIDWNIESGSPETIQNVTEVDIKYRRLGTYGIDINASSNRPADSYDLGFTDLIEVIPSTEPVTLDNVEVRLDGTLALEFSREMDPASIVASEFGLTLENAGIAIPVAIKDITIDPSEGNVIIISLDGNQLYYDDEIAVSYTVGSLLTTDAVASEGFSDLPRTSYEGDELLSSGGVDSGFENDTDASSWPDQGWGGIWERYDFSISSARAHTGSQSARIEYLSNGGMIVRGVAGTFSVEEGKTYELSNWVYVEDLGNSDQNQILPELRFYCDSGFVELGISPVFKGTYPTGEWVRNAIIFTAGTTADKELLMRGFNEFNPKSLTFFFDDLSIREVVLRP